MHVISEEDRYLDLILRFPLRPLRCDEDLDAAVAMIDSLLSQPSLKREEQDYLEVLGDLVEAYETEMHPLGSVADADLLSHLIEEARREPKRGRRGHGHRGLDDLRGASRQTHSEPRPHRQAGPVLPRVTRHVRLLKTLQSEAWQGNR